MFEVTLPYVDQYLQWTLFGNTGREYAAAAALFIGLLIVFYLLKHYVLFLLRKWTQKTSVKYDDAVINMLLRLGWPFYAMMSVYIATRPLTLPNIADTTLKILTLVVILFYAAKQAGIFVDWVALKAARKRREEADSAIFVLAKIAKISLWVLAFLLLLQNLGVEITPLIAALGVGGIAIAFALQNILEDLFSSFSIYFDKPFVKGDFIIVGSDMGVVKHIGLKTTRIQTLQGQELVISNRELTSTRVNNYKRMDKRRIEFRFGVEYSTSTRQLQQVKDVVRRVIDKVKIATLDRVHFKEFGDSALIFEVVYFVDSADYNVFMDTQEEINTGIKEGLGPIGVSMAFPTRTVHLFSHGSTNASAEFTGKATTN